MKNLFSNKISPFINYTPFKHFRLKADQNLLFPLWLKLPFLFTITWLFLFTFIQNFIINYEPNWITYMLEQKKLELFFLVIEYILYLVVFLIIFYLNSLNQDNYVLKIFLPFILYIGVEIGEDLFYYVLPNKSYTWFLKPSNDSKTALTIIRLFIKPILTLIAVIMFFVIEKTQFHRIYSLIKKSPILVILFVFLFVYLMVLRSKPKFLNTLFVSTLNMKISQNEQAINTYINQTNNFGKIFYISSLIFVFTVWEELIYRFAIQKIFSNQKNQGFIYFIVIGVFLFALPHISANEIGKPTSFIDFFKKLFYGVYETNYSYWFMSYILVITYFLCGYNLFFPIAIHVINNAITTL